MTAEVAVINTLGVALAADSAVTIDVDDKSKTYYTAQKIFNLSRKHSVGIMIYNDSEFMDINWEIIINEFSKAVGDRVFDTLEEYAKYFLTFLRDFVHITDAGQKNYLSRISRSFFYGIKDSYDADISENSKDQEINKSLQNKTLSGVLKKTKDQLENVTSYSTGFVDDGFVQSNKAIIIKELEEIFSDFAINEKTKEEMIELFLLDLVKVEIALWGRFHSGVAFAGYGDKEIFPSVINFNLFGRLGKSVLHSEFDISDVIHESNAWIIPLAQTAVINTFIWGIEPYFRRKILEELDGLFDKIVNTAGKKYAKEMNELKDEFKNNMENYEEENKKPIMRIVASLPKSNLAEMSEALVNLTALRQHVSTEEQTVGGPTDVALITKTDGFVWIKKKQLFQSVQDKGG